MIPGPMIEIDRIIHEPVRLRIMAILKGVDAADFKFLLSALGLTKGNLSAHTDKLEQAGYIVVSKGFNGRVTHTKYSMTRQGRKAFADYWSTLDRIRCVEK